MHPDTDALFYINCLLWPTGAVRGIFSSEVTQWMRIKHVEQVKLCDPLVSCTISSENLKCVTVLYKHYIDLLLLCFSNVKN